MSNEDTVAVDLYLETSLVTALDEFREQRGYDDRSAVVRAAIDRSDRF